MKIIYLILSFLCLSFKDYIYFISGEYNIGHVVPSHLYRRFDNVKEDIFPSEIRINMSLRRISGTLLYSIDKNKNQLIVTLYPADKTIISLEFRNKKKQFQLSEICKCKYRCQFEELDLVIQIKENISIKCNNGSMNFFSYNKITDLNKKYPQMFTDVDTGKQGAHLYLVNTPEVSKDQIYPNSEQLSGCIFNVFYNNEPIVFTNVTKNVNKTCTRACNNNTCNGGKCMENFNHEPPCDCTKVFRNGKYCNETSSVNGIYGNEKLKFSVFKLSWNSSANCIMTLSNRDVNISIFHNEALLNFEYSSSKEKKYYARKTLYNNYGRGKDYIFVATFNGLFINYWFFYDEKEYYSELWSSDNLDEEVFTALILRSGDGNIGFVYKENTNSLKWENSLLKNIRNLGKEEQENKNKSHSGFEIQTIVVMVVLDILILLCLHLAITYRKKILSWIRASPGADNDMNQPPNKDVVPNDSSPFLQNRTGNINGLNDESKVPEPGSPSSRPC